jgi:phosphomethylpyrimidine synthase
MQQAPAVEETPEVGPVDEPTQEGTQLELAREGVVTPEMRAVAGVESRDPDLVRHEVAQGHLVLPANHRHLREGLVPMGIGTPTSVKVNANIGASKTTSSLAEEVDKMRRAVRWGADTVMDLSTGCSNLAEIRRAILAESPVPVGTVPIYEMVDRVDGQVAEITPELALEVIQEQAEQGVDYMTIHAGVLASHVPHTEDRVTGIVSRGGSILAQWMAENEEENLLYTHFEEICEVFREHDVTFSLGDGLRPGSIADSSDRAQFAELRVLGDLTRKAWDEGCQVMVEGPGHIPLDEVEEQVAKQKELCDGAPFYTLGPLVTDVAPGYDHMTSMIGAAVIGWHGADMLCYVTPKEHLGLPDAEDVKQGLVAYNIAAHAADVARGRGEALDWDRELSKARFAFDWPRQFELALDPEGARAKHGDANSEENHDPEDVHFCSMCGPEFCSMRITQTQRDVDGAAKLAFEDPDDDEEATEPEALKAKQGARYPGITFNGT